MTYFWIVFSVFVLLVGCLFGLRWLDDRNDEATWQYLVDQANSSSGKFDPELIGELPEPARRYFGFTIEPGAPIVSAVELEMTGELGQGSLDELKYSPMTARQILAPPHGLVWRVRSGALAGSDGATPTSSWTRFWLFGLLPVVRAGDNEDHRRSAFGRVVAEAAFWTPAMLLPGEQVRWEPVDDNTARAIVSSNGLEQNVDVTVAPDGAPTQVVISRWSNENPDREYRLQPFGGYSKDFQKFGGYTLPTSVEGGNHFGTDKYFAFFKARITKIRFVAD